MSTESVADLVKKRTKMAFEESKLNQPAHFTEDKKHKDSDSLFLFTEVWRLRCCTDKWIMLLLGDVCDSGGSHLN